MSVAAVSLKIMYSVFVYVSAVRNIFCHVLCFAMQSLDLASLLFNLSM